MGHQIYPSKIYQLPKTTCPILDTIPLLPVASLSSQIPEDSFEVCNCSLRS